MLESKVKEERKQAGELGLLFAGRYLFLIGKHDKAKEYLDRAIKMSNNQQVSIFMLTVLFYCKLLNWKLYCIKQPFHALEAFWIAQTFYF